MKKILLSLMTLVLVLGLVGAGAFAWFSSTVPSTTNTFTAGTLNLNLQRETIGTTGFSIDNLKPGDKVSGTTIVKNTGSLPGWLYGRTTYTQTHTDNPDADLAEALNVIWWNDPVMLSGFNPSGAVDVTLKQVVEQPANVTFNGVGWMSYGQLASNATGDFAIRVQFDKDAGNEYQGDGIIVTFEFLLHQNDLTP